MFSHMRYCSGIWRPTKKGQMNLVKTGTIVGSGTLFESAWMFEYRSVIRLASIRQTRGISP